MKPILFLGLSLILLLSLSLTHAQSDRLCGDSTFNLWLDVVIVVDKSNLMDSQGLNQIASTIATVFGNGTRIGANYTDPRSTRVALVTYNYNPIVSSNLDTWNSFQDMIQGVFFGLANATQTSESYLDFALAAAENVLYSGRVNGTRANYKQVVILFASQFGSSGQMDPFEISDDLKSSGAQIITVAYNREPNANLTKQLARISSPGFNFDHNVSDITLALHQSLLKINCFCPDLWTQYTSDSTSYGICLQPSQLSSTWIPAKYICQNQAATGYLATEFTQQKHDFILENLIRNYTTQIPSYSYYIGLSVQNGIWTWEQPLGISSVPLNLTGWTGWWEWERPNSTSSNTVILNYGNDNGVSWTVVNAYSSSQQYVCESYTCDTDNYCA